MANPNWLTALGGNLQNAQSTGFYNDMFKSGDYAGIIEDVIRKAGGAGTMSPYYQKYLMKNAQKWMMQEALNQLAGGVGPNDGVNGENLGKALGKRIGSSPDGYIFDSGETSQGNFRQAIANASKYYGEEFAGTGAYELAHTLFDDPEMMQAMMMQSMGEGYGGVFRNGLMNQMGKQFDRFKNNLDLGSGNWWNDMYNMYGGFAGDKASPAALSGLPSMTKANRSPYGGSTTAASQSGTTPGSADSAASFGRTYSDELPDRSGGAVPGASVPGMGDVQRAGQVQAAQPGMGDVQRAGQVASTQEPYYGTRQELQVVIDAGGALPGIPDNEQTIARLMPEKYLDWYFSAVGRLAKVPLKSFLAGTPGQPEGYNQGEAISLTSPSSNTTQARTLSSLGSGLGTNAADVVQAQLDSMPGAGPGDVDYAVHKVMASKRISPSDLNNKLVYVGGKAYLLRVEGNTVRSIPAPSNAGYVQ